MSVKDGLLALLARGPSHGYQLKVDFEAVTGGAWTINVGQIYSSLQRLERDGLVLPAPAHGDDERNAYELTAAGREHLGRWLTTPVARTTETRNEVVMKLLLAASTPGRDPGQVIAAQRSATLQALQTYTRSKAAASDLAALVQLDRVILTCRAELDWLDLAEQRLAAHLHEPLTTDGPAGPADDDRSPDTNPAQQRMTTGQQR